MDGDYRDELNILVKYVESTANLVKAMPDCFNMKVDDIDLITRTLRCRKVEIFDYEEEVSFTAEEEAELLTFTTEDETSDGERALNALHDLDCLLRRIELMQLAIKKRKEEQLLEFQLSSGTDPNANADANQPAVLEETQSGSLDTLPQTPPEPATPLLPPPKPLSCEEKHQIANLQHSHHLLQCQIDELVCRYNVLRSLLKKLRAQLCTMAHQLRELAKLATEYVEWSKQVDKEKHVCMERYQYILKNKIAAAEAQLVAHNHMANAFKRAKKYLPRTTFTRDLTDFQEEIDDIMQFAHDLRKEVEARFESIQLEVSNNSVVAVKSDSTANFSMKDEYTNVNLKAEK